MDSSPWLKKLKLIFYQLSWWSTFWIPHLYYDFAIRLPKKKQVLDLFNKKYMRFWSSKIVVFIHWSLFLFNYLNNFPLQAISKKFMKELLYLRCVVYCFLPHNSRKWMNQDIQSIIYIIGFILNNLNFWANYQ